MAARNVTHHGGRARRQQHGHCFITRSPLTSTACPTDCGFCMWTSLSLEPEGPRPFLILLVSNCRVCIWEVFNFERPVLLYHISCSGLCWFMTSEILV